ncbi:hypothetical protein F2P81_000899 [Scophthalmus maximus]|uniref:Uncharacterized protein n=1 Tax=Scophthalmus maximus TaxID=52904 RepID=A0A6A4TI93_SCOMX|nr:hypothetical protein F2P81_000899 [Scophthalmus maximus]
MKRIGRGARERKTLSNNLSQIELRTNWGTVIFEDEFDVKNPQNRLEKKKRNVRQSALLAEDLWMEARVGARGAARRGGTGLPESVSRARGDRGPVQAAGAADKIYPPPNLVCLLICAKVTDSVLCDVELQRATNICHSSAVSMTSSDETLQITSDQGIAVGVCPDVLL